jgi:hypothetical protein
MSVNSQTWYKQDGKSHVNKQANLNLKDQTQIPLHYRSEVVSVS